MPFFLRALRGSRVLSYQPTAPSRIHVHDEHQGRRSPSSRRLAVGLGCLPVIIVDDTVIFGLYAPLLLIAFASWIFFLTSSANLLLHRSLLNLLLFSPGFSNLSWLLNSFLTLFILIVLLIFIQATFNEFSFSIISIRPV